MRIRELVTTVDALRKLTPYQRCLLDVAVQIDDLNRGDGKRFHPEYCIGLSSCVFDEERGLFVHKTPDLRFHNKLLHPVAQEVRVELLYPLGEHDTVLDPKVVVEESRRNWKFDPQTGYDYFLSNEK